MRKSSTNFKQRLLSGHILGISLLMFSACNVSHVEDIDNKIDTRAFHKNESRDQTVQMLARNLAFSLSNPEMRNYLKIKSTQKFDGDYNFLVETSKNDQIALNENGRISSIRLGEILGGKSSNGRLENSNFIDSLTAIYPLLQIAIPELENIGSAETWDSETDIPLVAFLPSDFDESDDTAIIPAYDFEGNYYELNAMEEPGQLTIVISDNERLIALERPNVSSNSRIQQFPVIDECPIMQEAYYESSTHLYYFKEDVYPILNECSGGGGSGGGSTGGSGSGTSTCPRLTNTKYDYINKAKFKDYGTIRQVESWASGKPEVRLIVSFARNLSTSNFNFTGLSYAMGENGWFDRNWFNEWATMKNFDYQIVRWDPEVYGNRMYYSWIEEDPSLATVSLNVIVSSTFNFLSIEIANVNAIGTATFSIGGADDIIASPIEVQFCDNTAGEGTEYKTPMHFWVNQQ